MEGIEERSPSTLGDPSPPSENNLIEPAQHWQALFGRPHPSALTKKLLEAALAYEEQCLAHGGLSLHQRKKLAEIVRRPPASLGNTIGKSQSKSTESSSIKRDLLPFAIGTEFHREWQGQQHIVVRTSQGLLWSGQTFSSLSAVARAITGTRWNGHRFFGLKRRSNDQ